MPLRIAVIEPSGGPAIFCGEEHRACARAGRSLTPIVCWPWKWQILHDHGYGLDSNLRCCTTARRRKKGKFHQDIDAMRKHDVERLLPGMA